MLPVSLSEHSVLKGSAYVYSLGDRICMVTTKEATSRLITKPSTCFFSNPPKYEFHAIDYHYGLGENIFCIYVLIGLLFCFLCFTN